VHAGSARGGPSHRILTLAKTVRDTFEAQRMINRVVDAKTEKILEQYELRQV
jgi:hypothetical protein